MPNPPDTTVPRPPALDALLTALVEQLPPDDPERCGHTLALMTTPTNRTALKRLHNLIGDALVEAAGVPDTFPVRVNATAGFLADAVLAALPDLLADHARHLAGLIHDATRADRDRNPGPGPQSDRNYARRGGMISARQVLDRYADQLDQQAADGGGQPATPTPADPWPTIARLTAWLDHHNGSSTPETTLRILKVQEEAGEVAAAWIGRLGQNPRKGVTHTTSDVMDELCDVIVAAMVALATLSADPGARFERAMAQIAAARLDTEDGEQQ